MATRSKREYDLMRALALVFKIAYGKSADEMICVYRGLIESGMLRLRKPPHQNTISRWTNDPRLTPILERMLAVTAQPFRAIEIAGIVDSSKVSQMRSAHSRWVEYGDDERDDADWMKLHALVGTETLVCMAAMFGGTRGVGTHDINFILPLLDKVQNRFALRYLLADKAYLSEEVVGELARAGIQAVIPIKVKWEGKSMKRFYEAFHHLVVWYDERQTDFHEKYRVRPKIESFFALLKNLADGYCWSRGRKIRPANADVPCTAWINETLCKLIYVNLRQIIHYETVTGYRMNLVADTFFPHLPYDKLIE